MCKITLKIGITVFAIILVPMLLRGNDIFAEEKLVSADSKEGHAPERFNQGAEMTESSSAQVFMQLGYK